MNSLQQERLSVENYGYKIRKKAKNLLKVSICVKLEKLIYVTTFSKYIDYRKSARLQNVDHPVNHDFRSRTIEQYSPKRSIGSRGSRGSFSQMNLDE